MTFAILKALIPIVVGTLFIVSSFLPDKHPLLRFFANFPRDRSDGLRIRPFLFGLAFISLAIFNLIRELSR